MISFIKWCFNLPVRLARKIYRTIRGEEWCIIHDWKARYAKSGAKLWLENHKFGMEIDGISLGGGSRMLR